MSEWMIDDLKTLAWIIEYGSLEHINHQPMSPKWKLNRRWEEQTKAKTRLKAEGIDYSRVNMCCDYPDLPEDSRSYVHWADVKINNSEDSYSFKLELEADSLSSLIHQVNNVNRHLWDILNKDDFLHQQVLSYPYPEANEEKEALLDMLAHSYICQWCADGFWENCPEGQKGLDMLRKYGRIT
jgi:hypothetical protein